MHVGVGHHSGHDLAKLSQTLPPGLTRRRALRAGEDTHPHPSLDRRLEHRQHSVGTACRPRRPDPDALLCTLQIILKDREEGTCIVYAYYPDVAADGFGQPLTQVIKFYRWIRACRCQQLGD